MAQYHMTGHLLKPLDCDISLLSPGTFGALSDADLIHYRMATRSWTQLSYQKQANFNTWPREISDERPET
jgi:hypothetical protein